MTQTRTSRIRFFIALACLTLLVGALGKTTQAQLVSAPLVLEDFSTLRMNHDSPPSPLWQPYVGGTSQGPGQQGSLGAGFYHDVVPAGQQPDWMFLPYPYSLATGFAKGNLRSGTWNANVNRLTFWMRVSGSSVIPHRPNGAYTASVGTYSKVFDGAPSNQGDHYYHYLYANWYPDRWMLITINRVPQHQVSQDSNINWAENPTRWTGNPTYKAPGWDYFDGLTRFYFQSEYGDPAVWGNRSYDFADFEFGLVSGEPDSLVASVTATYTGSGYELSWMGPKNTVQSYTVSYAPVSMHVNGLAAGTTSATTVSTSGDTYNGVIWASSAMAQPTGGLYFAIQPAGSSSFTEIYLPNGPYQGAAGVPLSPQNLRLRVVQ